LLTPSIYHPTIMKKITKRNFIKLIGLPAITLAADYAIAGYADNIVNAINSQYGTVCKAELKGFISKTLKIDWTSRTVKIQAIKIIAEIGSVKEKLYSDGVRYFQFPNDSGTYNVIDWKTGEKTSISDRATYHF
jgi:hypothetical protein